MSEPVRFTYAGEGKPPSTKSAAHEALWAPLVAEIKTYCESDTEWHGFDLTDAKTAKRAQTALRRYLPKGRYRTRLEGARLWARRGEGA